MPYRFKVTLAEATNYCGGQTFSIPLDAEKHGASWLNQGVQGGSHIYRHTFHLFSQQGYETSLLNLQVSPGSGNKFWTNVFPTELVEKHQSEIKRFTRVFKFVRWFEALFVFVPIWLFMKIFFFSDEFTNYMILPSIALFLGTGNATPEVSTVILERLFISPTYGMWYPADPKCLVNHSPPMVVFPNFSKLYGNGRRISNRGVTELSNVVSRSSSRVDVIFKDNNPGKPSSPETTKHFEELPEHFDELILCILPDTTKRLLDSTIIIREKLVLSQVKFFDGIIITYYDSGYMRKHYTPHSPASYHAQTFKPMYYIKLYPSSPSKLEMAFDCTNYQSQFPGNIPFEQHVFQTIFLNSSRDKHLWDWGNQLCQTHHAFVVPWLWLLNGRRSTMFAGSWTLVNAHGASVISGLAAAYRLGAAYPEELETQKDGFAQLCFRCYLFHFHGKWYRRGVGVYV
ncbi:hypothetical protein L873DRAFT_1830166 [Choiromyces venosus 120613-1]|uniref:FAD/NAD(P)-binding domain-containing protein n=1 Tax=Choiromyces venosus 120613-1 TaxID=1336337 RepID=A0A3N4JBG0_9PEZI|nr:hypothetical protein L873DRAFT_1830166 [Choiromyces venosus 120613-1]